MSDIGPGDAANSDDAYEPDLRAHEEWPGYWVVECVEVGKSSESRVYQAIFGGPSAEEDARHWFHHMSVRFSLEIERREVRGALV